MTEPSITLRAKFSSFTPGDNAPVTRIVIHATCPDVGFSAASAPRAAHGTALYFASGNAGGSAHYVCGVDGEEHCVPENTVAYHAPPNGGSIGIEITAEGGQYANNYTRDQWLSPLVWPAVQRAATRTRDLCARYGIPVVKLSPADLLAGKRGISGHVDVSQAWRQSTHSDPGPNFPWDRFMAEITSPAPTEDPIMAAFTAQDDALIAKYGGVIEAIAQTSRLVERDADKTYGLAAIRNAIDAVGKQVATADANDAPEILTGAILKALPAPASGGLTEADVETAIRKVLGGLDNTPA